MGNLIFRDEFVLYFPVHLFDISWFVCLIIPDSSVFQGHPQDLITTWRWGWKVESGCDHIRHRRWDQNIFLLIFCGRDQNISVFIIWPYLALRVRSIYISLYILWVRSKYIHFWNITISDIAGDITTYLFVWFADEIKIISSFMGQIIPFTHFFIIAYFTNRDDLYLPLVKSETTDYSRCKCPIYNAALNFTPRSLDSFLQQWWSRFRKMCNILHCFNQAPFMKISFFRPWSQNIPSHVGPKCWSVNKEKGNSNISYRKVIQTFHIAHLTFFLIIFPLKISHMHLLR